MMPQFALPQIYRPRLENFAIGLAFLLIGLAKKVLLADSWAPLADDLFDSPMSAAVHAGEAWRGVLAYTLQIYFDFSGYSDMAIGLSLLVGVRLPLNFNSPYQATSIIDFWRRWHMTLSDSCATNLLLPSGRKSSRVCAALHESNDHHAARRPLARRVMDIRDLGWAAWNLPRD